MKHLLLYGFIGVCVMLSLFYSCYTPTVYTFGPTNGPSLFIVGSVHGNEPSGTKACYHLIKYLSKNPPATKVTIMPMPNPLGYYVGSRYQLKPLNRDLNRNFSDNGKDRISRIILDYVKVSDFVVDLHEGYEFHKRYPASMGSSIIPSQSKVAQDVAKNSLTVVNHSIKDPTKQFTVADFYTREQCYLPDSLACYCNRHQIDYLSIETTGLLENQQPLDIRVEQHFVILLSIIDNLSW